PSAALQTEAQSSRSAPTAAILRTCIVLPAVATEVIRLPSWVYRTTPYTERHLAPAIGPMERSSPSTPMARALRMSIVLLHTPPVILPTPTATVLIRRAFWFC